MSEIERHTANQINGQFDLKSYPPIYVAWIVWGLGALLYAIGFFMRTAPAVMTNELMLTFSITETDLGQLASSFFYAYVLMQVPTGLLSRKYGPRRMLTAAALATATGTLIFAMGREFLAASAGLLLVGGSVGMAIVLTIELSGRWLPQKNFALASGLIMVVGVMGAFLAGMPLSLLVSAFGWRTCMLVLGILTALLGGATWIIVRDDPSEKGYLSYRELKSAQTKKDASTSMIKLLTTSFQYRNTYLMLLIPSAIIGAMLSFTGLWGVPYLKARFNLPIEQAALVCSTMLIAFSVCSPIIGYVSDRQQRRKPAYVMGVLGGTACWLFVVLFDGLPIRIAIVLLVASAACSGAMPLSYALGREAASSEHSDIVTGAVVTGIMLGPAIVQPLTGWLVDLYWNGATEAGLRIYDAASFKIAFLPMLAWMVLASLLVFTVEETYCGKKPKNNRLEED